MKFENRITRRRYIYMYMTRSQLTFWSTALGQGDNNKNEIHKEKKT